MTQLSGEALKDFLDVKADLYNRPEFIQDDPIQIPHAFSKKQDIEIAGFFAALLAWGQRKTIIKKCGDLMQRMDQAPYDFMLHAEDADLRKLEGFCHRTFNDTDLLYFVAYLQRHYAKHESLESAFFGKLHAYNPVKPLVEQALNDFRHDFFSLPDAPQRTRKHISSPLQKSTCKRLNMYLRWMVRRDDRGVDFGIWTAIQPAELLIPYDVHVDRVARHLGLVTRKQRDWNTTLELSKTLSEFDPLDPVKYDFALFGMGVLGEF